MIAWLISRRQPRVPERFDIEEAFYLLDGGTSILRGRNEIGGPCTICLEQTLWPRSRWFGGTGEPLNVDGRCVPKNSAAETAVIELLQTSLARLHERVGPADAGPDREAVPPDPNKRIVFGSPDLAELNALTRRHDRMAWIVEKVLDSLHTARRS